MIRISILEISIISCIYISLILMVRKVLNKKSFKYSSTILWGIIFLRLMFPYSIRIPLNRVGAARKNDKAINSIIDLIINFNEFKNVYLIDNINNFFPKLNRFLIILFIGTYVVFKIYQTVKFLSNSLIIENDEYINNFLQRNDLKRKIHVLVNDDLKYPITYGIIKPKIIIQSKLIEDRNILKYVLIHEMIHIRKFDVVWNHIKCILVCVHWYNPLVWIMAIYLNEDIEILCDKLVIEKTGNDEENKKDYCIAMLSLITEKESKNILGANLHPNVERMKVLKNCRVKKRGILLTVLMICITSTAFISAEEKTLPVTISSIQGEEEIINVDDRTREITIKEYNEVYKKNDRIKLMKADISDRITLEAFGGSKSYTFNMNSWTSASHKRFITNVSNISSKGNIDFKIIIEEDKEIIYSKNFNKDISLETTGAKDNRKYRVTIINNSNQNLSCDINIISYER